jgi:hypothetical protein
MDKLLVALLAGRAAIKTAAPSLLERTRTNIMFVYDLTAHSRIYPISEVQSGRIPATDTPALGHPEKVSH